MASDNGLMHDPDLVKQLYNYFVVDPAQLYYLFVEYIN